MHKEDFVSWSHNLYPQNFIDTIQLSFNAIDSENDGFGLLVTWPVLFIQKFLIYVQITISHRSRLLLTSSNRQEPLNCVSSTKQGVFYVFIVFSWWLFYVHCNLLQVKYPLTPIHSPITLDRLLGEFLRPAFFTDSLSRVSNLLFIA